MAWPGENKPEHTVPESQAENGGVGTQKALQHMGTGQFSMARVHGLSHLCLQTLPFSSIDKAPLTCWTVCSFGSVAAHQVSSLCADKPYKHSLIQ